MRIIYLNKRSNQGMKASEYYSNADRPEQRFQAIQTTR